VLLKAFRADDTAKWEEAEIAADGENELKHQRQRKRMVFLFEEEGCLRKQWSQHSGGCSRFVINWFCYFLVDNGQCI
jgi:hypothetical protein